MIDPSGLGPDIRMHFLQLTGFYRYIEQNGMPKSASLSHSLLQGTLWNDGVFGFRSRWGRVEQSVLEDLRNHPVLCFRCRPQTV